MEKQVFMFPRQKPAELEPQSRPCDPRERALSRGHCSRHCFLWSSCSPLTWYPPVIKAWLERLPSEFTPVFGTSLHGQSKHAGRHQAPYSFAGSSETPKPIFPHQFMQPLIRHLLQTGGVKQCSQLGKK